MGQGGYVTCWSLCWEESCSEVIMSTRQRVLSLAGRLQHNILRTQRFAATVTARLAACTALCLWQHELS